MAEIGNFGIDSNQIFVYINHKDINVRLACLHANYASRIFYANFYLKIMSSGQNGPYRYGAKWNRVPFCPN